MQEDGRILASGQFTSVNRKSRNRIARLHNDLNFEGWRNIHFTEVELTDANFSGLRASPSGDGVTHLEKYAMGMSSPFVFEPEQLPECLPTVGWDQPNDTERSFSVTLRSTDPNLDVSVEASSDLYTWQNLGNGGSGNERSVALQGWLRHESPRCESGSRGGGENTETDPMGS